jgi:excisionase family DNA binding protein
MAVAPKEIISASQDERSILDHAQDVLLSSKDRIPKLVGPDGDEIPLPPSLFLVLRQSIYHLMRGRAISIVPVNKELTTQEAADVLGVSRPYLVKLLEKGEIPYVRVGTQRRIRYRDVLEYQDRREAERLSALDEMARMSQEMGLYD